MGDGIIGLQQWFETPPGRYVLGWEQQAYEAAVADIFGYHALQLGLPGFDALAANRMPHRWRACTYATAGAEVALRTDYAALPFAQDSLDLVALPHTLDSHPDPHGVLREVARVLLPGGRVVLSGFSPASLWGLRQRSERWCRRLHLHVGAPLLPMQLDFIGLLRLRDWLHLLDFEIELVRHGCFRPLLGSEAWLQRWRWLDGVGPRWWPFFGAVYFMVAVKRVYGMRLLEPAWKKTGNAQVVSVPLVRRRRDNSAASSFTQGHNE